MFLHFEFLWGPVSEHGFLRATRPVCLLLLPDLIFIPEDEDIKFRRNIGKIILDYIPISVLFVTISKCIPG